MTKFGRKSFLGGLIFVEKDMPQNHKNLYTSKISAQFPQKLYGHLVTDNCNWELVKCGIRNNGISEFRCYAFPL